VGQCPRNHDDGLGADRCNRPCIINATTPNSASTTPIPINHHTAGRPAPATRKISNAISCSTTARRFTARDPAALDGQGTSATKVRREGQRRDDVSRADLILVPRHAGHPPTVRP
jgi:hypothetical protein